MVSMRHRLMNPAQATTIRTTAAVQGVALTREQRRGLLRLLLLARGLERAGGRGAAAGAGEALLTAVAATSAAAPSDRIVAPHPWLAAHLAAGAEPGEVASARARAPRRGRSRRPLRPGIGPQSPAGIGAGIALAIALGRAPGAADAVLALIDRRWEAERACVDALSLAQELALPLAVVAIDPSPELDPGERVVDRADFEAVVATVAEALATARQERRPTLVECAAVAAHEGGAAGRVSRFGAGRADPIAGYERRLMISGFSRAELDEIERTAADELERAGSDRGR
jgi:hypothetical protein